MPRLPKKVTTNPFTEMLAPEVQYWLGIMATDGCVHDRGKVSLVTKDEDLALAFCSFLGELMKPYPIFDKRYQTTYYEVSFTNKEVASYLTSLGITPRKSKSLKVNFPLSFSFFRGVMDGNGHIKKDGAKGDYKAITLCSASKEFVDQLVSFLRENDFKVSIYNNRSVQVIRVGSKERVERLTKLMYQEPGFFLNRKRVLLLSLDNEIVQAAG
jgi:hypothetical protein